MGSKWGLPWPTTTIDRIEQLGNVKLTFIGLSKKFGTFKTYNDGTDRLGQKKHRSRVGVLTDYGDIEVTLWCELVHKLIDEHDEQKLFNHIKVWFMKKRKWLTDKQEIERNALELHAYRIFDNPLWVDFVAFNEKYRPEVLEKTELVWVVNQVETTPQRITRVRMESDNATSFTKNTCGVWIECAAPTEDKNNEHNPSKKSCTP